MTTNDPEPAGPNRDDAFRLLGALGGILTLITALMFYFGWRRSEAQSRAMSIDVSLFGFTSQDYVLRSISALYLPLLVLSALGLGCLWLHARARRAISGLAAESGPRRAAARHWADRVLAGAVVTAIVCLGFTVAAGDQDPWPPIGWIAEGLTNRRWIVPLVLVLATVVAAYAAWVRRTLAGPDDPRDRQPWLSALAGALTGVIVVLGMVWMLEEYAAAVGRGYAQQLVASVDRLPRATVTSPEPLGIDAPGVQEKEWKGPDGADPQFRTTGLRLLARTQSKVLLVHDGWTPATGVVVVLPDSDSLTWQFTR